MTADITVTNLDGVDWAAMHEQATSATTVEEADRIRLVRLDGTVDPRLDLHSRRALFALSRYPLDTDIGDHYAYGIFIGKDPLLKELRTGGFARTTDDIAECPERAGPPGRMVMEIDYAPSGLGRVYVQTPSGRWQATYIVFGPAQMIQSIAELLPTLDADAKAAAVIEHVRIDGMRGGRPPGRPPAPRQALRGMTSRRRMLVAVELVELGGYTQANAARTAGVTPEALNRRLRARRLARS